MIIHMASDNLVVAELSSGENLEREKLQALIFAALDSRELERWSSMELEIYQGSATTLLIAVPVKVLLPECLLRFSKQCPDT